MLELEFSENMIEYGNFIIRIEPNHSESQGVWVDYNIYFKDSYVTGFDSLEHAIKYVRD